MKKHKSNKKNQDLQRGCLLFLGSTLVYIFISSLPLIIGLRISQYFHTSFYIGFYVLLVLLGCLIALPVAARFSQQAKPTPVFGNWRDRIVASLAVLLFCVLAFYPSQIGNDTIWAYALSFTLAFIVSILIAYVFGSSKMKESIRNFPKQFKRKRYQGQI
jgi:hypothetical protein